MRPNESIVVVIASLRHPCQKQHRMQGVFSCFCTAAHASRVQKLRHVRLPAILWVAIRHLSSTTILPIYSKSCGIWTVVTRLKFLNSNPLLACRVSIPKRILIPRLSASNTSAQKVGRQLALGQPIRLLHPAQKRQSRPFHMVTWSIFSLAAGSSPETCPEAAPHVISCPVAWSP